MEETDNSNILITLIDSMGQSEDIKRFDKTNYDSGNWIQDGYFKIEEGEGRKICVTLWGQISKSTIIIVEKLTDLDRGCLQIDNLKKKPIFIWLHYRSANDSGKKFIWRPIDLATR